MTNSFTHLLIYSFTHLLIYSFTHLHKAIKLSSYQAIKLYFSTFLGFDYLKNANLAFVTHIIIFQNAVLQVIENLGRMNSYLVVASCYGIAVYRSGSTSAVGSNEVAAR